MSLREDDLLRAAFHDLRALELSSIPRFRIARRETTRLPYLFRGFAAVILALFVIGTFASFVRVTTRDAVTLTSWKAPTDFLLETPQIEMLRSVPRFGERNGTR